MDSWRLATHHLFSVPPQHRGQLTLETLMVALVGLGLLLVAVVALNRIQSGQQTVFEQRMLQTEAGALQAAAEEICVLGEGNARMVPLAPMRQTFEYDAANRRLILNTSRGAAFSKLLCPIELLQPDGYGEKAYLWFERDTYSGELKIRMSNQPRS